MLKLKFQYFGHLMPRANSLEKTPMLERLKAKGEGVGIDEMVKSHHWHNKWSKLWSFKNMNWSKLWEIVKDKEAWRATVHGVTKSQT